MTNKTTILPRKPNRKALALLGVSLCLVLPSPQASAQVPSAQVPSAKDFAMKPSATQMSLSPEGGSLSFLSTSYELVCRDDRDGERIAKSECEAQDLQLGPNQRVIVVDTETMTPLNSIAIPTDYTLNWTRWTTPDTLLISTTSAWKKARKSGAGQTGSRFRKTAYEPPTGRIISVKTDNSRAPVVLFGDELRLLRQNRRLSYVVDTLHDDPNHVVMPAYRRDDLDLFRVNIEDGSAERIAKGQGLTYRWLTDREGKPALRLDCTSMRCRRLSIYRPEAGSDPNDEDAKWVKVRTFKRERRGEENVMEIEWIAPTGQPDEYYVIVEGDDHERRHVKTYNFRTDTFTSDVLSVDGFDVSHGMTDPETGDYAGVSLWKDRLEYDLLDASLSKHMRAINRYFDNRWNVRLAGFSKSGGKVLVHASAPQDPGGFYMYDFDAARIDRIIGSYDNMPAELLSSTSVLSVPTRDGKTLTAYHTVPSGSADAPLITLIHGGPESRDRFDYDRTVQFLASRGFQVLQVNFRGSSGYGRDFAHAGYRQWSGTMHEDVMDALAHVQAQGLATPSRGCVMGYSYGGYAALFAGAKSPEAFSCVIAGASPTDLVRTLKDERSEHGSDSSQYEYWTRSIGDMRQDRDALDAVSPVNMADRYDDPVLLFHGVEDKIVAEHHSEAMYEALNAAGKTVRYFTYENEGHFHNQWNIETREHYLDRTEAFLLDVFPDMRRAG